MHLKLPTLKYRRLHGDMIEEVFKITHNIYDPEVSPEIRYYPTSNTRGNKYKLLNHTFHCDTRKYSFSAHIVNIWNSLPNFVNNNIIIIIRKFLTRTCSQALSMNRRRC